MIWENIKDGLTILTIERSMGASLRHMPDVQVFNDK